MGTRTRLINADALASLPVAPLVHEALEFLAILCVAEIFHVVRELALGGGARAIQDAA
jgi:hypothetical protein